MILVNKEWTFGGLTSSDFEKFEEKQCFHSESSPSECYQSSIHGLELETIPGRSSILKLVDLKKVLV